MNKCKNVYYKYVKHANIFVNVYINVDVCIIVNFWKIYTNEILYSVLRKLFVNMIINASEN